MKTRLTRKSLRRGMTYVSVVIAAVLIGLTLATYLKLVASQNQMTMRSQAWNRNIAVVEAGIEEALAHLNKNGVWDITTGTYTGNLLVDGWTTAANGGWTKTGWIGEDYYVVTIAPYQAGTNCPTVTAEGYVKQVPAFAMARRVLSPFLAQVGDNGATYVKRTVMCATTNVPTFSKALVAKKTIDMNGNNTYTDSYDSSNPLYSSNGVYTQSKRRDHGDVATNNSLTNSLDIGNANIWGSVSTGPNAANPGHASMEIGSNGKVGDSSWQADNSKSGVQAGHDRDDMNVYIPDVTPPFKEGLAPATPSGGYVWTNGVNYDTVLGSGTYKTSNLDGRKILVRGNTKILVTASFKMTGNDLIQIAPGASLTLYMDGASAEFGGNGVINGTGLPSKFLYFGTPNNTQLNFGGNAQFTAAVYAPSAAFVGNGGGNDPLDFSGAAIVNSAKFNGHYSFHYDEALGRFGMFTGFTLTSWNEM